MKLLEDFLPANAGLKVFSAPHMPCRVYVAGYKDTPVPDIVRLYAKHLAGIYTHRHIARLSEMDRRLLVQYIKDRVPYPALRFPADSWVRIRTGTFKGDVARVYKSYPSSDVVELMVVPRLRKRRKASSPPTKKRRNDPTQALHVAEEVPDDALVIGPIEGTYMVGDDVYFENGLKYIKAQGMHYAQKCTPTADDVWFFTLAGINTLRETNTAFLRQQNRVILARGSKRGLQAVVKHRDEETVDVETSTGTSEHLAIGDVERVFEVGSHITVRLGHAKGRSGLVLATVGKEVTFAEQCSNEQVSLCPQNYRPILTSTFI